jgi:hypothetical protein
MVVHMPSGCPLREYAFTVRFDDAANATPVIDGVASVAANSTENAIPSSNFLLELSPISISLTTRL